MKVIVLTEGGENIGFGHISRCLSICQAFEARGAETRFVINGDDSVKSILKDRQISLIDWLTEEEQFFQTLQEYDVVIVDSYLADIETYQRISQNAEVPLYLDDTVRLDYPPGVVINWSICAMHLDYPQREGVSYLLGPRYVALRSPYREDPAEIPETVGSVMVTFGGDDSKNITPKVVSFLADAYPQLDKYVVIGQAFTNNNEITSVADDRTYYSLVPDGKGMRNIMDKADVAICSGGQTIGELARMGVPAVAVAVADNQVQNVRAWVDTGFVIDGGSWKDHYVIAVIACAFERLMVKRNAFHRAHIGKILVDGKGADRILDYIEHTYFDAASPDDDESA
ncbi:MAG: UDP-2,4-diacetamido-2,4,6-trideoxy-beta-L-altropyranose hydrolase [bacterium]|nr:UDP-2,4-diacetamido-2,4,6-trideoxy-beta-L-altropyranose hydrolase [bacterium]